MIRKIASAGLVVLGIVVLIATTVSLVQSRLSLPVWSVQTEGRWVAYGIESWAFWMGWAPLGLLLLLGGILLWPSRPTGVVAKGVGIAALVIAFAGLVATAGLAYGALRNESPIALLGLTPLLAMVVLGGSVTWKLLRHKKSPAI